MPFRLKNAGVTYQRLVNRMFSRQIGRNIEVYVDDMLVKSKEENTHLDDLKETFATLKQFQIRLNLGKCAFSVSLGKFLRFMVRTQKSNGRIKSYGSRKFVIHQSMCHLGFRDISTVSTPILTHE